MIRHIVSWTLTAEDLSEKLAVAREIKERLEGLAAIIPGVARAHVGIDLGETAGNWDVVLDSDFASREDLERISGPSGAHRSLGVDRVGALPAGVRGLRALTRFGNLRAPDRRLVIG